MVKKGPWTVTEDSVLAEYVRKHGEGNWNVVEKNSGLERCGKSCRLRWFNHLRPNLKRGAFTPEEERIIVYLHSQFGNKWARIALRLPGRTDNEIKNYWNTRSKRLERAGLPLYPDGIVPKHNQIGNHNKNGTTLSSSSNRTHFSKPDGRGVSSVASSSSKPLYSNFKLSPQLSMGPFSYSKPINPSPYFSNSNFQKNDYLPKNGSSSNNPFSSTPYISPFPPSPSTMFNPCLETQFSPTYPFQLKPTNFNINPNPSPYSVANTEGELSSIQLPMGTTPISYESSSSNGAYLKETSFANDPDPFCFSPLSSDNGLLEDVWAACSTLVHNENMNTEISTHKGKEICMSGSDSGSSSLHTSTRKKVRDAFEEMAITFDDDLSSLLDDFPLNVPSPEWYNAIYGNSSNENPKI